MFVSQSDSFRLYACVEQWVSMDTKVCAQPWAFSAQHELSKETGWQRRREEDGGKVKSNKLNCDFLLRQLRRHLKDCRACVSVLGGVNIICDILLFVLCLCVLPWIMLLCLLVCAEAHSTAPHSGRTAPWTRWQEEAHEHTGKSVNWPLEPSWLMFDEWYFDDESQKGHFHTLITHYMIKATK